MTWEKGQKRPWNAELKCLTAFKLGDSFVKNKNSDKDVYGSIYEERKAYETDRHDRGENKELALELSKKVGKSTEAYKHNKKGKLSPGHLHARARRYAVKLFLAHYHEVAYWLHHKVKPPLPYVLTLPNHSHKIEVPNPPWG